MPEQMTIAIVDDEQDMRESISQWLTLSGYRTTTFTNAEDALRNLDSDFRGIIISDIRMPGMDGISFLRSCLLYTSPSPRDGLLSRMPSSA